MRISTVIPCYNEAEFIGPCLDALVEQLAEGDEIIVVDNNSQDNTAALVQTYEAVRLVAETKQGIVYARNAGFNAANGDIIARIDADTIVLPGWLSRLRMQFEENDVRAISGSSYFYDVPFRRFGQEVQGFLSQEVNRLITGHHILFGSNMAIAKSLWEQVKGDTCLDTSIHEDLDLAIHAAPYAKIVFDRGLVVGVSYRRGKKSVAETRKYLQMWPRTFEKHDYPGDKITSLMSYGMLLFKPPLDLILKAHERTANRDD